MWWCAFLQSVFLLLVCIYLQKLLLCYKHLNRQIWENGYTQVVNSPTRRDALLDVYLVRPESSFTSCSNVRRISGHCGVLLEVERGENYLEHQVERLVPVYRKTNVPGLQNFLRGKFASWASSGGCVEEIWERFNPYPANVDNMASSYQC